MRLETHTGEPQETGGQGKTQEILGRNWSCGEDHNTNWFRYTVTFYKTLLPALFLFLCFLNWCFWAVVHFILFFLSREREASFYVFVCVQLAFKYYL